MAHRWVPQGDDGAIVFRSWLVLSSHPPLVGQLTHVTSQHAVFDPGPMLFWLLAVPVHIDPRQGGLWGAALLCVVGASLAVEAGWSAYGWPAAVGVVAVVLVMVGEFPAVALDPTWNAHMGTVWFMTTAAVAWAVAVGRLRWWPVLVVAGSFAAQCHLMFAVGSLACVVIAPIVGMAGRRPLRRWLPAGILAGIACWAAPLYQQVTSHPGNLSLLLHSQRGAGPTAGVRFGLQALAASVGPRPVWWDRGQVPNMDFYQLVPGVHSHSPSTGVAVLVGLLLCVAIAWRTGRRALGALALITLVLALAAVWTLAMLPMAQFLSLIYIAPGLWPVGMIVLLIGAWSVAELALAASRRLGRRRTDGRPGGSALITDRVGVVLAATAAALVVVAASALVVHVSATNNDLTEGWPLIRQVTLVTQETEHAVPRGRLIVRPSPGFNASYGVITGLDFLLYADGWRPESPPGFPTLIGPQLAVTRPAPEVRVTVTYQGGPARLAISRAAGAGPTGGT
jgi:hypothetical protein